MKSYKQLVFLVGFASSLALADGSSIDTVYLPYVQPMEKEVEYQLLFDNKNREYAKNVSRHQFAYGQSVHERLYLEASVSFSDANSFELTSYEIEAIYQLTEQGEYASDWGMLVELGKIDGESSWEAGIGLLNSISWQRWQLTTNLILEFEWGDDIEEEFETAFAGSAYYRNQPAFEPGIEIYAGQDTHAIGPAIRGLWRINGPRKLYWSSALLFGSEESPNRTFKFELEYEYY